MFLVMTRVPAARGQREALSTALYAASRNEIAEALRWFAGVRVWATDREGRE